jgi:hypothetical protein
MNTKPLLWLSFFLAAALTAPIVNAGPHRNGGNRVASRPARTFSGGRARPFVGGNRIGNWNGQHFAGNRNWNGQHWNSNHWSNNWNWHHNHRNFVFVDFGFPFWGWGYPYYYDYGYSCYGCYPYGGNYGYGGGYGSYGYNYGNGYGYNNGSGNGYSGGYDAKVAELQRRLANAGYYRGEIDGIWGSRTQYALKAYRHDHPNENDAGSGYHNYPTLRNRPYSPPPTTTEPSE